MKKLFFAFGCLYFLSANIAAGVNLQSSSSAMSLKYEWLDSAFFYKKYNYRFAAKYQFFDKPLVVLDSSSSNELNSYIDRMQTIALSFSKRVNKKWSVAASLPLSSVQMTGLEPQLGMGDIVLQGKYLVSQRGKKLAFALLPQLELPTGDDRLFLSNTSVGVGVKAVVETHLKKFILAANWGYMYRNNATQFGIDLRHQLPIGLGAVYTVNPRLSVSSELIGVVAASNESFRMPMELYLGSKWKTNPYMQLSAGVSIRGVDDANYGHLRVVAGIEFYPSFFSSKQIDHVTVTSASALTEKKCEAILKSHSDLFGSHNKKQ